MEQLQARCSKRLPTQAEEEEEEEEAALNMMLARCVSNKASMQLAEVVCVQHRKWQLLEKESAILLLLLLLHPLLLLLLHPSSSNCTSLDATRRIPEGAKGRRAHGCGAAAAGDLCEDEVDAVEHHNDTETEH